MRKLFLILFLITAACGKTPPDKNGDGLPDAIYKQQNGFVDVTICGIDVHTVDGKVRLCNANPYSQTDDSNYTYAWDNYYMQTNDKTGGVRCWFKVTGGKFDSNATAPPL